MRGALLLAMIPTAVLLALAPASRSRAHGFEVGVLALHELEPGRFAMRWRPPEDSRRATPARVTIRFPDHCRREHHELRCGPDGLHGAIAFDDLPDPRSPIVVRVERLDGRRVDAVVRGDAPSLELGRASATLAALEQGARSVLGLEHLLVVLALVLAVGLERRALPALAAFVVGHALGLALELSSLPSALLSAMSAAGVVLLARGALDERERSWTVLALLVGLALGLARADRAPILAVGATALADLLVLGLLAVAARAARAWIAAPRVRIASAYALGVAGALWLIERSATFVTP